MFSVLIYFPNLVSVCKSYVAIGKQNKVAEYYKKQKKLLEELREMETIHESGAAPAGLTEVG